MLFIQPPSMLACASMPCVCECVAMIHLIVCSVLPWYKARCSSGEENAACGSVLLSMFMSKGFQH